MKAQLLISTTSLLELVELKNEVTGEIVTNATVTAVLRDSRGRAVSGQAWPLTMAYIDPNDDLAGRLGLYRGILSASLALEEHKGYSADVTATVGSFSKFWQVPVLAEYATS